MRNVAIVTGGSRGIGAAVAKMLGASGYSVAVNYARDAEAAAKVVAAIEGAGSRAFALQGDVSREEDILRLFRETDKHFGPLTALVNNAGMLNRATRVADMTADAISRVLAVNTFGSILCAREAVKRMSTKMGGSGGAIVNLSSVAARMGGAERVRRLRRSRRARSTPSPSGCRARSPPRASASTRSGPA